jgi:hypothetical protein
MRNASPAGTSRTAGGLLAYLGDASADHVVDPARVHPGALDEVLKGESEQVDRMPVGKRPASAPEGGAHGVDDYRLARSRRSFF